MESCPNTRKTSFINLLLYSVGFTSSWRSVENEILGETLINCIVTFGEILKESFFVISVYVLLHKINSFNC